MVIDGSSNKPVPYVNIYISGTSIGYTSDEDGVFRIDTNLNDTAIFSAVGYETRRLPVKSIHRTIFLTPKIYEIKELVVDARKEKKEFQIGKLQRQFPSYRLASAGYLKMIAQHIPYKEPYDETPFIESITFLTHSNIKKARFNIRLLAFSKEGMMPGKSIYHANIIGIANKGNNKTKVHLTGLDIRFPKEGLVVAIEWLNIEENKHMRSTAKKDLKKKLPYSIEPSFSLKKKSEESEMWYYWGNWYPENHIKDLQIEVALTN